MTIPVLIDTDISLGTPRSEIDDGAAILLLLNSPEVKVKAITTVHGNLPVEQVMMNLFRLLKYHGGNEITVAKGAGSPLIPDPAWERFLLDWQAQYGVTPPAEGSLYQGSAVDLMIEIITQNSGELVIMALGPMTNLALALQKEPKIQHMIRAVYAMGGSFSQSDQAEFNIRCDPEAAAFVCDADWPIWLHGLDITRQVLFTRDDFSKLDRTNQALSLLHNQATGWISIVEAQGWEVGGCSLHDAVPAAALIDHSLCSYRPVKVGVSLDFDGSRGVTTIEQVDERSSIQGATTIDWQACKQFILKRVQK